MRRKNENPCGEHGPSQVQMSSDWHRFIPAHAGNTVQPRDDVRPTPVHPRACGEHNQQALQRCSYFGSSPRMRGTPTTCVVEALSKRFIPAHAGNTPNKLDISFKMPVHPRACGEHGTPRKTTIQVFGSSPRMRGTRHFDRGFPPVDRFIPAHAGNTPAASVQIHPDAVHPRACGEHLTTACLSLKTHGSSPRMRGTPSQPYAIYRRVRFIPAHAGNTIW